MNTFISSFRPLLFAVATIMLFEIAVVVVAKPNIVERSNYLNWMYQISEPFHKLVIQRKLSEMVSAQPDIVQVGDSSGFFGIRPNTVMKDIGGLQYFNLSCCAGTGFDGYYDIATFAAAHVPNLRAVVVYLTPNNLPRPGSNEAEPELGATKLHDSFVGPWAFIKFPSMLLRPTVTDNVYTLFGLIEARRHRSPGNAAVVAMEQSVRDERGWWPEHDPRRVGAREKQFFRNLCGDDDVIQGLTIDSLTTSDGDFRPLGVFDKFAAFAESRGKKLIIVFHPHPCRHWDDRIQRALAKAVSSLKSKYPNLSVYPEELFEHWPRETFSGADHLRVGYERHASQRLGVFLADSLGLPTRSADRPPPPPSPPSLIRPAEKPWIGGRIGDEWRLNGVVAANVAGSATTVTEAETIGRHALETKISGAVPGQYYLASVTYKPLGDRIVNLSLKDANAGPQGRVSCNFKTEEATPRGRVYDGSMNLHADGLVTCWGIFQLRQSEATLDIELMLQNAGIYYRGDSRSGLLIHEFALFVRADPDALPDPAARH
jgi:hypothetical protein